MLQNAEGVSASPLLDDLGLLGWSSRKPRQVVARATVPRRPVRAVKGGYVHPPRTPTFRDAMNGVLLQLDIVVYTMP